jgi:CheY-like chemotaxis protein
MKLPPGRGETILIVDDDDLVRPSAVSLIESLGYRVLSAGNGHDALEILRQNTRIDLLFTDLFMPGGMHGPQLVAEAAPAPRTKGFVRIRLSELLGAAPGARSRNPKGQQTLLAG